MTLHSNAVHALAFQPTYVRYHIVLTVIPCCACVRILQVAGQLFGVTVEAADGKAPVWNADVRFFCIKQDGKPKAYFFFVRH